LSTSLKYCLSHLTILPFSAAALIESLTGINRDGPASAEDFYTITSFTIDMSPVLFQERNSFDNTHHVSYEEPFSALDADAPVKSPAATLQNVIFEARSVSADIRISSSAFAHQRGVLRSDKCTSVSTATSTYKPAIYPSGHSSFDPYGRSPFQDRMISKLEAQKWFRTVRRGRKILCRHFKRVRDKEAVASFFITHSMVIAITWGCLWLAATLIAFGTCVREKEERHELNEPIFACGIVFLLGSLAGPFTFYFSKSSRKRKQAQLDQLRRERNHFLCNVRGAYRASAQDDRYHVAIRDISNADKTSASRDASIVYSQREVALRNLTLPDNEKSYDLTRESAELWSTISPYSSTFTELSPPADVYHRHSAQTQSSSRTPCFTDLITSSNGPSVKEFVPIHLSSITYNNPYAIWNRQNVEQSHCDNEEATEHITEQSRLRESVNSSGEAQFERQVWGRRLAYVDMESVLPPI
jgi:hypothetical protein